MSTSNAIRDFEPVGNLAANGQVAKPSRDLDALVKLGVDTFERKVKPHLRPEDDNKFVAVDIESGDFEIDEDDLTAINRLHARRPNSETLLMRAGWGTTCRIR